MPAKRLGLIANTTKGEARDLVLKLQAEFVRHGVEVLLEKETAEIAGAPAGRLPAEIAAECDLLVVLGGDGTMLQVLHQLDGQLPPIFGINIGTLGFLTCAGAADYLSAVECIVSGSYTLSKRTLLQVEVRRGPLVIFCRPALNDAVISRGEISRLIRLRVQIDGANLTEYNADGLIVATPTGSTAYSLSAGGPVLTPDSGVFVINPICPHVLTNRAVIVADGSCIDILPPRQEGSVFLTLDGREAVRIEPGDVIRITRSSREFFLAMLPGATFFEVLSQKLKWSGAAV